MYRVSSEAGLRHSLSAEILWTAAIWTRNRASTSTRWHFAFGAICICR